MPIHPLQIAGVAIIGVAAVLAAIDLFSESSSQEQHYSYQSNQSNHSFQNSSSPSSLFRSWGEKSQGNGGEKSSKPKESGDELDILEQILYEQQPEERAQEPRSLDKRQEWLSRLIDIGFSRISCIQALEYCGNFNDALEYLLQQQSDQLDDYPNVTEEIPEISSISLSDHPNSEENLHLSVTHPPLTPSNAIEIHQLPGSFINPTDPEEKDQETPFPEIHTKLNDSECFDIQLVTVSDAESIVEQLTNADSSDEWDMISTASDP
jgi:hypothetical protein